MSKTSELHSKAERVRETEQDFLKSLQLADQASVEYSKEENYEGMADVCGTRALGLTHLYEKTGDDNFLIMAKHAAGTGVEIAKKHNLDKALAMASFRLGKVLVDLQQFSEAVSAYEVAVENDLPDAHNRPAVKSDIRAQLGFAQYMSGDKESGIANLNNAIEQLENNDEEIAYTRDVWLSGAYMKKAFATHDNDHQASSEALASAKKIIDNNNELVLRKRQWEKLASKLSK